MGLVLAQCIGGPIDGEKLKPDHPFVHYQQAGLFRSFGRHVYALEKDGNYHYRGPQAINYASAGNALDTTQEPDSRRRR